MRRWPGSAGSRACRGRRRVSLPVSTRLRDEALEGGVAGGVVDVVVVPEAPEDAAPGAAEDADGVLVGGAAGAGAAVDVGGPGVVGAGGVGALPDRGPETVAARPAGGGPLEVGCSTSVWGEGHRGGGRTVAGAARG